MNYEKTLKTRFAFLKEYTVLRHYCIYLSCHDVKRAFYFYFTLWSVNMVYYITGRQDQSQISIQKKTVRKNTICN